MRKQTVDTKAHCEMLREAAHASLTGELEVIRVLRRILVDNLQVMTGEQFVATVQHIALTLLFEEAK